MGRVGCAVRTAGSSNIVQYPASLSIFLGYTCVCQHPSLVSSAVSISLTFSTSCPYEYMPQTLSHVVDGKYFFSWIPNSDLKPESRHDGQVSNKGVSKGREWCRQSLCMYSNRRLWRRVLAETRVLCIYHGGHPGLSTPKRSEYTVTAISEIK